jgi:hypothetical protein
MTNISPETQKTLDSLRKVAADTLDRKRRLGHYAIIWHDGQPVAIGEDAPDHLKIETGVDAELNPDIYPAADRDSGLYE